MNQEALVASLKHIRSLASDCLRAMGEEKPFTHVVSKGGVLEKRPRGNTLPDRILELKDGNFFKQPRTTRDVQEKLRDAYPCEHDRVAMALLRLMNRKKLRKASKLVDGKRQIAYVW
jgi:hypothetical protein